jgi:hypothetical protein
MISSRVSGVGAGTIDASIASIWINWWRAPMA